MPDLPPDAYEDHFHPPSLPTEVYCLHCQRTYESYLIEWRESDRRDSGLPGYWCCPTPGCSGAGFGFDIHPVDPDYIDPDGRDMGCWCDDDDCDDDCTGDEETCCCDCCLMGRGEYEDEFDDDCECGCPCGCDCDDDEAVIPLDDLLPVNESIGEDLDMSYDIMMEIEERLGFHKSYEGPSDTQPPASPPKKRRGHPPISEDDIPF